jgi:type I restriction enzyme R subunit
MILVIAGGRTSVGWGEYFGRKKMARTKSQPKEEALEKLSIILQAEEHILSLEDGWERYLREVLALSKAFAIAIPREEALAVKDIVAFYQAVKARLQKFQPSTNGRTDEEMETTIRQIVDKAIVSEKVIDIFDAAGIKKPDISILSEEFLQEMKGMKHRNLAMEVLKKILDDEIRARSKYNLIQGKTFREKLEEAIRRYQNKLLTAAEVIQQLIELAKEIKDQDARGDELKMSREELVFYDAVANNQSARDLMGDDTLRDLASVLVDRVRQNATIDWTLKESVKSKLRVIVKRTLREYGYPPDMEKMATEIVLSQANLFAEEWARIRA